MKTRTAKVSQGEFTSPLSDNFKRKMLYDVKNNSRPFPEKHFRKFCDIPEEKCHSRERFGNGRERGNFL